jgi:CRP-like cAMP-binding protein
MSPTILSRTGILAFMDDESREQLARYGRRISTIPGQAVIREGDENGFLFIVLGGTFNVTTRVKGHDVHLDTVGKGDCLGEVAIFHPDRASATVTSLGAGELWSIYVDPFQEFLLERPAGGCAAILGINIILSRRLKRANAIIRSNEILPCFLSVRSQKRPGVGKPG